MVILVRLFGVAVVVMGLIFAANIERFKAYMSYWKKKRHQRQGAFLAITAGVIFLIAAPDCKVPILYTLLGIWGVAKGALLLITRQKKLQDYLDWWINRTPGTMRFLSFVFIAFGLVLVYFA